MSISDSGAFMDQANWRTHVDILRWRALQQPAELAYSFLADGEHEESSLTNAELDQQVRRIAVRLQELEMSGERALLLYPQGLEYVSAFYGCLYAGTVAVPAYPPSSQRSFQRIWSIIADAQVKVVLTTTSILARLHRSTDLTERMAELDWITTDALPVGSEESWQDLHMLPDDLAFLQYTSGSTATPKGVMVSYGNLIHNNQAIQASIQQDSGAPFVSWLPLFHDMGLIANMLQAMYCGVPCILMPPSVFIQKPILWLKAISFYKAHTCGGPNFAYDLCVQRITAEQRAPLDLSHWKIAFCGAEPIHAQTIERFAKTFAEVGFHVRALYPCYGLAESTVFVSGPPKGQGPVVVQLQKKALERMELTPGQESDEQVSLVGSGQTWEGQQAVIVDPETRMLCSAEKMGEIWLRGPSVAQGYWQRAEETRETFQAFISDSGEGPFLRTGDLGFFRNGQLFITGRLKDIIIVHGRNLYPQDIERTVEFSHPALRVAGCAAFSVAVESEERVVIVQEIERHHQQWSEKEIFTAIRKAVSAEHEVSLYAIVLIRNATLPKTSSGKVQRRASKQRFLDHDLTVVYEWKEAPSLREMEIVATTSTPARSATEIKQWLVANMAARLQVAPQEIDVHAPFAYYGLTSLASVRITEELERWLGISLSPTLVYEYPTIEALTLHIAQPVATEPAFSQPEKEPSANEAIAVIGVGCRFPSAQGIEAFWQLLAEGRSTVTEIPADRWQLADFYDPEPGTSGKMYTRSGSFLNDVRGFDAPFFGISPHEAVRMDPQQRLLLEVTWEALEHAGIAVNMLNGSNTGMFLGMLQSSEYSQLQREADRTGAINDPYFGIGSSASIAAGRIAYLFDWHGPTLTIDTACSSSLAALHLACQSLRTHECDVAVVAGVNTLLSPDTLINACKMGMLAADGRCKTFDKEADGYVMGEGCGVVVLKRLSEAQVDGHPIHAIVRGSALNHDGLSNGITAPNKMAQKAVIRKALQNAGILPQQISYVETHGSGTVLGDAIEAEALASVVGEGHSTEHPVFIGSVKTNMGHLLGAAGIAGFIKTVLALQKCIIPPHLNVQTLTPSIPWQQNNLALPLTAIPWPEQSGRRFAGVSSFGWSGTNVHVILEGAAESPASQSESAQQILVLSAKSQAVLEVVTDHCVAYLQDHLDDNFADIAYTYQCGRAAFDYRRVLLCEDGRDALTALRSRDPYRLLTSCSRSAQVSVVFLFPGVGEQYPGMARELYQQAPRFREVVDECCTFLKTTYDLDLMEVLELNASAPRQGGSAQQAPVDLRTLLKRTGEPRKGSGWLSTQQAQPAIFVIEYALARLLQSWGIEPGALIGYSLGEYVAACVAGVFTMQEALHLVTRRAQLIARLPEGRLLAVLLSEQEARRYEGEGVSIAALNGSQMCVLGGGKEPMEEVARRLQAEGIMTQWVEASHAFHTPLLRPVGQELAALVAEISLKEPQIPYISNVTGDWQTWEQVRQGEYWVRHMCEPVRWKEGVAVLLAEGERVMVEVGVGQSLGGLVRQHEGCSREQMGLVIETLPAEQEKEGEWKRVQEAVAKMWLGGVQIDWEAMKQGQRRRVSLPTYPFEHQSYWIEHHQEVPEVKIHHVEDTKLAKEEWCYAPIWKRSDAHLLQRSSTMQPRSWVVFTDSNEIGTGLAERLQELHHTITIVRVGERFERVSEYAYTINPRQAKEYDQLFQALQKEMVSPLSIVHLWNITTGHSVVDDSSLQGRAHERGFYSLLFLVQALGRYASMISTNIIVGVNNAHAVIGEDLLYPEQATAPGICKVLNKEYEHLECRCIDISLAGAHESIIQQCLYEVLSTNQDEVVAYRGGYRWVQVFESVQLPNVKLTNEIRPLREHGVYLITGGLGGLGSNIASYLARTVQAKIVLLGRSAFPERGEWMHWVETHDAHDPVSAKIHQFLQLEMFGAEVLILRTDITDGEQLQQAIVRVHKRFGSIAGVFHLAGVPGHGFFQAKTIEQVERVFAPKINGTIALQHAVSGEPLDFLCLFSSSTAVFGGLGEGEYAAANAFLDAFAHYQQTHSAVPTYSINWGPWQWDAWQKELFSTYPPLYEHIQQIRSRYGITFEEGNELLAQLLATRLPQVVVLPQGWQKAYQQARDLSTYTLVEHMQQQPDASRVSYPRPPLHNPYVAPTSTTEQKIAAIWQKHLGIERVGISDNFFELGGSSLIGILIIHEIQKELEVQLSVAALFECPTIASLAALLSVEEDRRALDLQVSDERGRLRKARLKRSKQNVASL